MAWRAIACAALLMIAGCTQSPTSPSAVVPDVSVGRLPQIAAPVPPRLSYNPPRALGASRFLAFGDSITAGVQSAFDPRFLFAAANGGYPERLQAGLNAYFDPQAFGVENWGLPGEFARQAASRFRTALDERRPEVVLLLEGINDLNTGSTIEQTVNALEQMVTMATSRGTPVLIATMYPTYRSEQSPDGRIRENSHTIVPAFNEAIRRRFTGRVNVHVVDLEPRMQDRSFVGNDGLHPTDAGFERMAAIFLQAIERAFPVRGSFQ